MLPLWIIDLQQDGKRRERLQTLISSLGSNDRDIHALNYWKVTSYEDKHLEPDWFRGFVDKIVGDGEDFVRYLNKNNPVNDPCINVCVLGDASEIFTLTIFSAVASIIKKEKALIIPDHVQQGINVLGMLYVPSDVNTLPYLKRQGVLRCLKELQVQRKVDRAGSFDKVMLYQDTQHRTEKFYPLLTPEQQVDYVFQCLIHLYYICDQLHPLLDGSHSNDDFYFTMGAGSLYYDTIEQDDRDEVLVGNKLVNQFKEKGYSMARLDKYTILDLDISPESLLPDFDIEIKDQPDPRTILQDCKPHPVNDFASLLLKKRFYGDYLTHYVENYQKQIIRRIAHSSQEQLLSINEKMDDTRKKVRANIDMNIPQLIRCSSEEVGGLSLIDGKLGELGRQVIEFKSDLKDEVERCIWHRLEDGLKSCFKDAFRDYHDAFCADREKATPNPACDEMKKEKVSELTGHLKNDSTVLSRMARAFLAGIVSVLAFMPVLETISPRLVNLGDVQHHPFMYAFTLFLLPAIIEAIRFWRYHRKRKRLENELVAYYLHDSYARIANRQYNKVNQLYDYVLGLVEKYKQRCERIRTDTDDVFEPSNSLKLILPKTMFNQPVIGGTCCRKVIFADEQQNHNTLLIDIDRVKIDKVTRSQGYFLINKYSDQFSDLFKEILIENSVLDPQTGETVVLSKEEMAKEEERRYLKVRESFEKHMKESIKYLFIKRVDSTVGEKLDLYRKSVVNARGFDLFCRFNATNGEFTANDNESFADIKSNSARMKDAFGPFLPMKTTYQVIDDDDTTWEEAALFKRYLFLTRWRTFNFITASRILPEIDLDDRDFRIDYGFNEGESIPVASIVLYCILGNLSSEWYTLFDSESIERLQIRLHGRKRGTMTWQEIEKLQREKDEEMMAEEKKKAEEAEKEEMEIALREGTIPYYDKILDTKVD